MTKWYRQHIQDVVRQKKYSNCNDIKPKSYQEVQECQIFEGLDIREKKNESCQVHRHQNDSESIQ